MLARRMTSRRQIPNSVKRTLFGSVDHQQIKEDLQKELAKISEEKSKTWNFDFKNFKPLPPGRYKWERVGKRLQTRRSPTESCTTNTAESNSQPLVEERPPKRTRYNLRTRGKDTETEFRPIDSPMQFPVSRAMIARPIVNAVSKTGSVLLSEQGEGSTRVTKKLIAHHRVAETK